MAAKAVKLRPQRLVGTRENNQSNTTGDRQWCCSKQSSWQEIVYCHKSVDGALGSTPGTSDQWSHHRRRTRF